MQADLIIKNIGRLVTMEKHDGRQGRLGVIENAYVAAKDGRILDFGQTLPAGDFLGEEGLIVDANGGVVMPGLVDCHTHLVHAGFRQNEFKMRSEGMSYQEIARLGGGIMSTVRSTRAASLSELIEFSRARADEALSQGTTTMEIKTGYGLDLQNELKMVDAIGEFYENHPLEIVGTFLGAHIVPYEFIDDRMKYLHLVKEEMLPAVAGKKWMTGCDVFVEDLAFRADEAREIAAAARANGLSLHLHVDQFGDVRGAELASELGALSADHLDHTSERGMQKMAKAGVIGVLLPGASFFTGKGSYPDVKKMLSCGMRLAVASDYNPGTTPSLNLMLNASIAVTQMGMTCDDAILGITKNAAAALGLADRGAILKGARADLVVLDAPDEYYPLYRYGLNFVKRVVIDGRSVKVCK